MLDQLPCTPLVCCLQAWAHVAATVSIPQSRGLAAKRHICCFGGLKQLSQVQLAPGAAQMCWAQFLALLPQACVHGGNISSHSSPAGPTEAAAAAFTVINRFFATYRSLCRCHVIWHVLQATCVGQQIASCTLIHSMRDTVVRLQPDVVMCFGFYIGASVSSRSSSPCESARSDLESG